MLKINGTFVPLKNSWITVCLKSLQRPVSSSPEIKVDQLFVSGKGRRVITKGREFKAMRGTVAVSAWCVRQRFLHSVLTQARKKHGGVFAL